MDLNVLLTTAVSAFLGGIAAEYARGWVTRTFGIRASRAGVHSEILHLANRAAHHLRRLAQEFGEGETPSRWDDYARPTREARARVAEIGHELDPAFRTAAERLLRFVYGSIDEMHAVGSCGGMLNEETLGDLVCELENAVPSDVREDVFRRDAPLQERSLPRTAK